MTISMSDILSVTNRLLCREDFLVRIEKIAAAHPAGIILREKDLCESEYQELAGRVLQICRKHWTPCILHSFTAAAAELKCDALHLPLPLLRTLTDREKAGFQTLGVSCHSAEEAAEAEALGCTYITAGHIFDTACKSGLPGRGIGFLRRICESVSIPVYAIGGIEPGRIAAVRDAGAAGGCVMSGAMACENVQEYFAAFEEGSDEIS